MDYTELDTNGVRYSIGTLTELDTHGVGHIQSMIHKLGCIWSETQNEIPTDWDTVRLAIVGLVWFRGSNQTKPLLLVFFSGCDQPNHYDIG